MNILIGRVSCQPICPYKYGEKVKEWILQSGVNFIICETHS